MGPNCLGTKFSMREVRKQKWLLRGEKAEKWQRKQGKTAGGVRMKQSQRLVYQNKTIRRVFLTRPRPTDSYGRSAFNVQACFSSHQPFGFHNQFSYPSLMKEDMNLPYKLNHWSFLLKIVCTLVVALCVTPEPFRAQRLKLRQFECKLRALHLSSLIHCTV